MLDSAELADYSPAQGINVLAQREWVGEQARLTIAVSLPGNASNRCAKDQNCIVAWSVLSVGADGQAQRVFHDGAVRNRAAAVVAEEEHCLANDADRVIVLIKDRNGERHQVSATLN